MYERQPASQLTFESATTTIEYINSYLQSNGYELQAAASYFNLAMGCSAFVEQFGGSNFEIVDQNEIDGLGLLNLSARPQTLSFIAIGDPQAAIPLTARLLVPFLGSAVQKSFTLTKLYGKGIEQDAIRIEGIWEQTSKGVVLRRL
jgi:hypothetical protein